MCRMNSMITNSSRKRGSIYTSFVFSIWEVHSTACRYCLPFRVPPCRCRLPFRVPPPFLNSIPKPQSRVHFHSDIRHVRSVRAGHGRQETRDSMRLTKDKLIREEERRRGKETQGKTNTVSIYTHDSPSDPTIPTDVLRFSLA